MLRLERKPIIKFSASSSLILINKHIEMHGQQNIKKKLHWISFSAFLRNDGNPVARLLTAMQGSPKFDQPQIPKPNVLKIRQVISDIT